MEKHEALRHLFQELSIGTYAYQFRAARVIENWLRAFWKQPENSENFSHALRPENLQEKITVRVKGKPPSLQLIHHPEGGLHEQRIRVSAKLLELPEKKIVTVEEKNLTRETLIVTLEDTTMEEILKHRLIAPEKLAAIFKNLRELQPTLFIVIDRYLMGIEQKDNQKVPFHLIEQKDEETWQYLEEILR